MAENALQYRGKAIEVLLVLVNVNPRDGLTESLEDLFSTPRTR